VDSNNPIQTTPVQTAAPNPTAAPVQPNPVQPAQPQPAAPEKGSNKMLMWFIIGIVVIVAAVGGFYLYSSRQQAVDSNKEAVSTQTPAPVVQENLDMELDSVNIDTADSDFAALDQDLQQL
jgi:uncharacterized protein HemX